MSQPSADSTQNDRPTLETVGSDEPISSIFDPLNRSFGTIREFIERHGEIANAFTNSTSAGVFLRVTLSNGSSREFWMGKYHEGEKGTDVPADLAKALALWDLLTPEQRNQFKSVHGELARMLDAGKDQVPSAGLPSKWLGVVRSVEELEHRSRELRSGEDLIDGIVPHRALGLVIGDSGLGKSPLMYQLAVSVASGTPFLGRKTNKGRVLYVDYENGVGQIRGMIATLTKHIGLSDAPGSTDLLILPVTDAPPEFDTLGHTLFDLIRDLKPDLVIVDSLTAFCPKIEDQNSIATEKARELRRLISEVGCTVLSVHHVRKPSEDAPAKPLEEADPRGWFLQTRGARALINSTDVRIGIDTPSSAWRNLERPAALVMRGFARVTGEIPTTYLERVCNDEGDPQGYRQLTGANLLRNDEQQLTYEKLPARFTTGEARRTYGKGSQPTSDFLHKCEGLGLVRKLGRGEWERTQG